MTASKCPKCDNDLQGADLRRGACPFCGYVDYSPYPEPEAPKGKKGSMSKADAETPLPEAPGGDQ